MTIQNGQLVDAVVTNSAFVSKTDTSSNNKATGIIQLENATDLESGSIITNIQKRMNDNKFITSLTESISASGTITAKTHGNEYLRVIGDGAPVTLSATPFGSGDFEDGKIIRVVGTSDSNHVKVINDDNAKGAILNGDATLKRYHVLELMYDSVLERFIEIGRNW